ncbi:MAG: hypothetical protein HKP12_11270 [Gammaproteobacteria bacterium]|nr:hypothetical protein [Gammaproteobacteria bacterium]
MKHQLFTKIAAVLDASEKIYNIRPLVKNAILIAPIVIIILQAILLIHPGTRDFGLWLLEENHPVELLTFVMLLAGGGIGLLLALKTRRQRENGLVYGFYMLFSIGLVLIAMEEVAWGQWFLGFETPEAVAQLNRQGETTIHNLAGLHGHSEFLRLTFGLGGLIGIWLSFSPSFRKISAPVILVLWFLIITIHASVDVYNDFVAIHKKFDYGMQRTAELIELLIAISAYLYLHLNWRMLVTPGRETHSLGSAHK